MFCHKCGTKEGDQAKFCHNCGGNLLEKNSTIQINQIIPTLDQKTVGQHGSHSYKIFFAVFGIILLIVIGIIFSNYHAKQISLETTLTAQQQRTEQLEGQLQNVQEQSSQSQQVLDSTLEKQQEETRQAKKQLELAERSLQMMKKQQNINSNGVPYIPSQAIVLIVCGDGEENLQQGSGTLIDPNGYILTNAHVVTDDYGNALSCIAMMNDGSAQHRPLPTVYNLTLEDQKAGAYEERDAVILKIKDAFDINTDISVPLQKSFPYIQPIRGNLQQGDTVYIFGYPKASEFSFNVTKGIVSSFSRDGLFINTDAIIDSGNSGGAAFSIEGNFIGIPTQVYFKEGDYLGRILDINSLKIPF